MRENRTFDALLELQDEETLTATQVGKVDSSAVIRDIGLAKFDGEAVIDVDNMELTTDQHYRVSIQGSDVSDFATGIVDLAVLNLGVSEVLPSNIDSVDGRTILPFNNVQQGVVYRYIRSYYEEVAGTAPSIDLAVRVGKR